MKRLWELLFDHKSGAWTAAFTVVLAAFTYLLYEVAQTADETARTSQRAFLNYKDLQWTPGFTDPMSPEKVVAYQLAILWENTGSTPVRLGKSRVNYRPFLGKLPSDFDYRDIATNETNAFVAAPRAQFSLAMIPPIQLNVFEGMTHKDSQLHRCFWGWATYFDVFPKSEEHLTEFCIVGTRLLNTTEEMSKKGTRIIMNFEICPSHNCYDKDCPDYQSHLTEK